jgi:Lipocalin-like domain
MKRVLISAVAFAFSLMTLPTSTSLMTLPKSSASENFASSIIGTWKLTSFARKELATGKTARTYGDHPQGYAHYTKGGHFLIFAVAQDRKKNENIFATDAERVELFKTMFAWGGTYRTEGNNVIYNVEIAWVQSWVGTTRTYQVEIAGNKLTVATPPFKSPSDGQDIMVVTTYERAE